MFAVKVISEYPNFVVRNLNTETDILLLAALIAALDSNVVGDLFKSTNNDNNSTTAIKPGCKCQMTTKWPS